MDALDTAMELYPYVFHPAVMVGVGALVTIHHEWALQDADRSALWRRFAAFLGAGVLSLVPTLAYVLVTGQGLYQVTKGNAWQVDALVAGGVLFTAATTWLVWRRYDWGALVPGYLQALVVATIPYVALSPFWNFSGHVTMALMPTLYLTLVDRRFWPTLAIPVVMVPNRVYLDAHDWPQSVGAFLIIAALVVGVFWWQTGGEFRAEPGSAAS
ncbi:MULTISPECIES: phosphoesterase [Halorussus]|uniref:phosphoesterase n=1 Tax=Halorussus TaxID=1070314 RepID=UPI000E20E296|nr:MULTISPECIES: phosphoesterase [Halorussus]NHN59399.1 phosphoesterase [Halorussus sp. JP-T4]